MEADILQMLTALSEKIDVIVEESEASKKFRIKMETEVIPKIGLLSDGFKGYADKVPMLEQMADDIDTIKLDMEIVKAVMKKQSNDITKIRAVK